ncbi:Sugar phosphate isomerase/epimerase [Paraburkholderia steynii]|uniref:Sugar phosphate isomerase/epimerase n=1 Tax=Paraburkholderia steynii TaxID=1245441 RepID=A0A7Z7B261_9BURK|nr:sugar phosphate isomerase/epimerase [Paraburkholderia steynii]SDH25867.1 Sugar phosphate isomerase/epimerase [Paraburkholderia steynii]
MKPYPETTMWTANVRRLSFAQQIEATVEAGFDTLTVTPLQYTQALAAGMSSADLLAMASDSGIRLTQLDPLARWSERWHPQNIDPAVFSIGYFAFAVEDFLRIARALRLESITAISIAPPEVTSVEQLTEDFAKLCDRAADDGIRCDLEFIPLDWSIPDLDIAWKIVRDADKLNSGIAFDVWHFCRSGSSLETLRTIPGDKISYVQLCDGSERVPAHRSLFQDCLEDRKLPGEGDFPVRDILGVLKDINGLNRVGPEIFSRTFDEMSAKDIGRACGQSLATTLEQLGIARSSRNND